MTHSLGSSTTQEHQACRQGSRPLIALLLVLAVPAALLTIVTWLTGGVVVAPGGWRISSRTTDRPFAVAAVAWILFMRAAARQGLDYTAASRSLVPASLALCGAFAWWHAAPYAAAADMFGYVSQALDWRAGSLAHPAWVRDRGSFPVASAVPLGYVLRAGEVPAAIALYPPGTSLHMALLGMFGTWAMYLVSPLAGLAVVLGTYHLGRVWFTEDTGRLAAVLMAFNPQLLAQSIVPMSDTLAAAYWVWSLVCAASARQYVQGLSGVFAGLAIAVRPNLAPLFLAVAGCTVSSAGMRGAVTASLSCVPFVAMLGWHNVRHYGSPLATGYGRADHLFSLSYVPENVRRYGAWLVATVSPLPIAGALAHAVAVIAGDARGHRALLGFVLINMGLYLVYLPWPNWTFSRFLLPALPLLMLMAVSAARRIGRRLPLLGATLVLVSLGWEIHFVHHADVRGMTAALARFQEVPAMLRARQLTGEPIVTRLHSGSLRLYAGARTFRWDHMSAEELRNGLVAAQAAGQRPLLIDDPGDRDEFEQLLGPISCWADESAPLLELQRHGTIRVLRARPVC